MTSLKNDFTSGFTFRILKEISDFEPHILKEGPDDFNSSVVIHEVEKSRIDCWASNKLGIGSCYFGSKPNEDKIGNTNQYFSSDLLGKIKMNNNFKAKAIKIKDIYPNSNKISKDNTKLNQVVENILEENITSSIEIKRKTNVKTGAKSFFRSGTISSKEDDEIAQSDLVPLKTDCIINNDIYFGKEEEKAIEIYFRQREIDKLRKKKMEIDLLEENEKKNKRINEDNYPYIIYDMEGNLIKPVVQNPDKLRQLPDSKYVVRTEEEMRKYK